MEIKPESQVIEGIAISMEELKEVNEDANEGVEVDCWPRESEVMRYSQVRQWFESVQI